MYFQGKRVILFERLGWLGWVSGLPKTSPWCIKTRVFLLTPNTCFINFNLDSRIIARSQSCVLLYIVQIQKYFELSSGFLGWATQIAPLIWTRLILFSPIKIHYFLLPHNKITIMDQNPKFQKSNSLSTPATHSHHLPFHCRPSPVNPSLLSSDP